MRRAGRLSDELRVPAELLDRLRAHATAAEPMEACALLAGSEGPEAPVATHLHEVRNAARSPYRFEVHPDDLVRVVHHIEAAGERLVAIAHSHPSGDAVPSPTDLREARWDVIHIIVGRGGRARAWRYADGRSTEIPLRVTSPG